MELSLDLNWNLVDPSLPEMAFVQFDFKIKINHKYTDSKISVS